jgi:uncharacterized protein YbjQ (UPF0145 family)
MTENDVIGAPSIQGFVITDYLGIVFAAGPSNVDVMEQIIAAAVARGAHKVISFFLSVTLNGERFYGQGTAVTVRKTT